MPTVAPIKPIETEYKGYRFRSRLEARWAVFFDLLGIEFDYEAEGYEMDGVRYLPDFWIPHIGSHVEIKPDRPDAEADTKARKLAARSLSKVYIFFGPIPFPYPSEESAFVYDPFSDAGRTEVFQDDRQHWCRCPRCGSYGIAFGGDSGRLSCCGFGQRDRNPQEESLCRAYLLARSFRFEIP